jgi:hypothetical protein
VARCRQDHHPDLHSYLDDLPSYRKMFYEELPILNTLRRILHPPPRFGRRRRITTSSKA